MIPNCKRDNDTAWIEARLTNSFNVYNNTNSCVETIHPFINGNRKNWKNDRIKRNY